MPFQDGMLANGYSEDAIRTVWNILVPFSGYAFNRAHAAAYGLIAYRTAWLKAHYPAEYMAALLTSVGDDKDKSALYLAECRRMGIKVLPPDVSASGPDFTPVPGEGIRFGLAAVRNLGDTAVAAITAARQDGPFAGFYEFLHRVPASACNKRGVESLIKAGAFDSSGAPQRPGGHSRPGGRRGRRREASPAGRPGHAVRQRHRSPGRVRDPGPGGGVEQGHPAGLRARDARPVRVRAPAGRAGAYPGHCPRHDHRGTARLRPRQGRRPAAPGLIASAEQKTAKKNGGTWALVTLEDQDASIEACFFCGSWLLYGPGLVQDRVAAISGHLSDRGKVTLIADTLEILDTAVAADGTKPVVITMPLAQAVTATVHGLKDALHAHPGLAPVHLRVLPDDGSPAVLMRCDGFAVSAAPGLFANVKAVLGPGAIA